MDGSSKNQNAHEPAAELLTRWNQTPERLRSGSDAGWAANIWIACGVISGFVGTIAICNFASSLRYDGPNSLRRLLEFGAFCVLWATPAALFGGLALSSRWIAKQQKEANLLKDAILLHADISLVSPMFELTAPPYVDRYTAKAKAALTLVLPRVTADNTPVLSPPARRGLELSLTRAIKTPEDKRYSLAVWSSLQCFGNSPCLPIVKKVAKGLDAGRIPQIQQAAQEYLDTIRALADKQQIKRTHLRASDAPKAGADTLLRSAMTGGGSLPELLLRPGPNASDPDAAYRHQRAASSDENSDAQEVQLGRKGATK